MPNVRRAAGALLALSMAVPAIGRAGDPLATFRTAPRAPGSAEAPEARGAALDPDAARPPTAQGPREVPPVRFVLQVAADIGSSTAYRIAFVDGTTQDLNFNQGASVGVGASFLPLAEGALSTQVTFGFEYGQVLGANGSVRWLTFPLEIMEVVDLGRLRLGAGLSCLLAPRIKGEGVAAFIDHEFEPSFGFLAEVDVLFPSAESLRRSAWWLGVRFETQELQLTNGGGPYDANAIGFVLGAVL